MENLHVSIPYVYKCDLRLVCVIYGRDVVHIHVLTLGKNMDVYVETPGTCQPEPIMC